MDTHSNSWTKHTHRNTETPRRRDAQAQRRKDTATHRHIDQMTQRHSDIDTQTQTRTRTTNSSHACVPNLQSRSNAHAKSLYVGYTRALSIVQRLSQQHSRFLSCTLATYLFEGAAIKHLEPCSRPDSKTALVLVESDVEHLICRRRRQIDPTRSHQV